MEYAIKYTCLYIYISSLFTRYPRTAIQGIYHVKTVKNSQVKCNVNWNFFHIHIRIHTHIYIYLSLTLLAGDARQCGWHRCHWLSLLLLLLLLLLPVGHRNTIHTHHTPAPVANLEVRALVDRHCRFGKPYRFLWQREKKRNGEIRLISKKNKKKNIEKY